jgi:hypothetical protein
MEGGPSLRSKLRASVTRVTAAAGLSSDDLDRHRKPKPYETVWRTVASRKGGVGTTAGATWPQFLKACRTQLVSTTSTSPLGGFAPAPSTPTPAPALRQRRRNPVIVSVAAASNSLRLRWGVDRRRICVRPSKLSIAVLDRQSFGLWSMSTHTSTISPARGTTAKRRAGAYVCEADAQASGNRAAKTSIIPKV